MPRSFVLPKITYIGVFRMELLIGVLIAYFGALFVLSLVVWQFSPFMGAKLFKKGTGIFVRIAQKTLKLCFKVGVRIALYLYAKAKKFVFPWVKAKMVKFVLLVKTTILPKVKQMMISIITKIKNIQKGAN